MITHIIWDYNGTVINDVDASVAAVNDMLTSRGLPTTTKTEYTDTVSLPLDKYYSGLGITDADMSKLSQEFRKYCKKHENLINVFSDFYIVIEQAINLGIKNILISSLYNEFLFSDLEKHDLIKYFDKIIGMNDTLVGSKFENAKTYIKQNELNPNNILFVGDLISDAQIAKKLGAKCVLIPNGHNSKQRCLLQEVTVLESLKCLIKYLK